jgi:c-di-AMP phosphodiesterase-like protein
VKLKAQLTQNAEIILDKIAMAAAVLDSKNAVLVAAQTADDLLKIKGIGASFVLVHYDETIYISGRSYGDINVQLILEKLGGGGHLTVAGAQLKEVSLEEAQELLIDAVQKYIREGEED